MICTYGNWSYFVTLSNFDLFLWFLNIICRSLYSSIYMEKKSWRLRAKAIGKTVRIYLISKLTFCVWLNLSFIAIMLGHFEGKVARHIFFAAYISQCYYASCLKKIMIMDHGLRPASIMVGTHYQHTSVHMNSVLLGRDIETLLCSGCTIAQFRAVHLHWQCILNWYQPVAIRILHMYPTAQRPPTWISLWTIQGVLNQVETGTKRHCFS